MPHRHAVTVETKPQGGCPECGWPDREIAVERCWRQNLAAQCRRDSDEKVAEAAQKAPIRPSPSGWGSSRWGGDRRRRRMGTGPS